MCAAQARAADTGAADQVRSVPNVAFPQPVVAPVVDLGPVIQRADLAPYFATGKAAEAKAAFDTNKFAKARELLDGVPDSPPVRFLRALAAFRELDFDFASKEMEALAEAYPALRDRCLVHAGWAYEGLKDWSSARRVFSAVSAQSRVAPDARFGEARALRNTKDYKAALEILTPYAEKPAPPWGRDVGAEGLQAEVDLFAWQGAHKPEHEALLKLWSRHPLTTQGRNAEEKLGEVGNVPTDALVTRADVLIDAHRNDRGVALLEPLLETLKLPDPLACKAHFSAGKAYRKLREHAKAAATLGPVIAKCKDPDIRAKALYTLGFSQTIVAPSASAETYTKLAHDYPANSFADDGLFFAADAYFHLGNNEKATERLVELVDQYPQGDYAADGLFKLFWIARDQQKWDDALAFLEEIEVRFAASDESYEVERARYWRGRMLEAKGQVDAAISLYRSVSMEHPATYYGLISRERVEKLDPSQGTALCVATAAAPQKLDPFPIHAGVLGKDPQFLTAVELLRLGFGELVPMEILAIDRSSLNEDSLRLMVLILSAAGEERSAHGLARIWLRRDLSGRMTPENRAIWEVAYPQAFRDFVTQHSKDSDQLDPDLLQALMREESALDPKALSWAGALGLCQLMPATAAEVAGQLKVKYGSTNSLLEPDLNIRLGAKYLSGLLNRAKGVKQFALAGYNAGEGSVGRWRRDLGDDDLAAWVEQIPVQETRGYVKRVLRSYNTYKLLYVPGEFPRTIAPVGKAATPPAKSSKGS